MSIYGHTVLTYHTQMVRCEKEPFTFVGNLLNQGVTLPPHLETLFIVMTQEFS